MTRLLSLLALAALAVPSMATELSSSTTTITPGQVNEPAGALVFSFGDNEFPGASPTTPVYIRLCLPEGVRLGSTLVGPLDNPINLGTRVLTVGSAIESNDATRLPVNR